MGEAADEIRRPHDGGARGQDGGPHASSSPTGEEGTEELRTEIEQTRAEMSETIDAIQAQLSPEHLKEQAKERAREATVGRAEAALNRAREAATRVRATAVGRVQQVTTRVPKPAKRAGSSVGQSVKRYPIPPALVGLALSALMIRMIRGRELLPHRRSW